MIWHIYSHLYCSLRDGGRDLPYLGEAAPTMGQVPCEFQADWPNFIFQLMAPDAIWHIYSIQYCFKGVLGMDLLSSGDVALTMGQVPCELQADWPTFIFQLMAPYVIWHIYSHLYCSSRDGGRDLLSSGEAVPTMGQVSCKFQADLPNFIFSAGGSWHHLAHLLHPALLQGSFRYGPAIFRGCCCHYGAGALWVGHGAINLPSSGEVLLGLGKVPCESIEDHTKHWGSYPWGVCQGPRPLKSESGRMEHWNVVSSYVWISELLSKPLFH